MKKAYLVTESRRTSFFNTFGEKAEKHSTHNLGLYDRREDAIDFCKIYANDLREYKFKIISESDTASDEGYRMFLTAKDGDGIETMCFSRTLYVLPMEIK